VLAAEWRVLTTIPKTVVSKRVTPAPDRLPLVIPPATGHGDDGDDHRNDERHNHDRGEDQHGSHGDTALSVLQRPRKDVPATWAPIHDDGGDLDALN